MQQTTAFCPVHTSSPLRNAPDACKNCPVHLRPICKFTGFGTIQLRRLPQSSVRVAVRCSYSAWHAGAHKVESGRECTYHKNLYRDECRDLSPLSSEAAGQQPQKLQKPLPTPESTHERDKLSAPVSAGVSSALVRGL